MESRKSIPKSGEWPVPPQEDQPIIPERIWVDGCFDFTHHGHAGALLQAKQLGNELLVGIHSDESIMHNKGPTVMTLDERVLAVEACRWADRAIPHAPYVTSLPWISHYGCQYVVHGDDITTDSGGEDSYRYVKQAGRFLVVKRTPGISTTDLVGRMLLFSKSHFIQDFIACLQGDSQYGSGSEIETSKQMNERMVQYGLDASGKKAWVEVHYCGKTEADGIQTLVPGMKPLPGQRIVYVDGSFDLFSSGHIEFLKQVVALEEARAQSLEWNSGSKPQERLSAYGIDYKPFYLVVGLHSDRTVNEEKGSNYPIMNLYERALLTMQCEYVNSVILNAPWTPSAAYLTSIPGAPLAALYHGPTTIPDHERGDPYAAAKEMAIYVRVGDHKYSDVNAAQIVQRILKNRALYEERQRKKGWKKETEEALLKREKEEAAAAKQNSVE